VGLFTKRTKSSGEPGYEASTAEEIDMLMRVGFDDIEIPFDPDGYFYGPVAQGLAIAAPMVYSNAAQWNSPTDVGALTEPALWEGLTDTWGIPDAERWLEVVGRLVDCTYGDWIADHATVVRTRTKQRLDVPVLDDARWAQALAEEAQRVEAKPEYLTDLQNRIPEIRKAEQILRDARLLGADEEVQALGGYDLVRAGSVVRWGAAVGWGEPELVLRVALASRDVAAQLYTSWRDYGLGMAAGKLVTYPSTWGLDVAASIRWLRPFTDSPDSPWNHLPFPHPSDLED